MTSSIPLPFSYTLGNHAHTDGRIQMLAMRDFSTEK